LGYLKGMDKKSMQKVADILKVRWASIQNKKTAF